MSIFRSIRLRHWYPNVNIQIDPFATLVPKLPNVNIQIDPFATLVPRCQYSDRSIRNSIGWGRNPNIIHLAGAAIRMRNHNYEDPNYDLNAQPKILTRYDKHKKMHDQNSKNVICSESKSNATTSRRGK